MRVRYIGNGRFAVKSRGHGHDEYLIYWSEIMKRWVCNCPDFQYRRFISKNDCKHIKTLLHCLETASEEDLNKLKEREGVEIE